MVVQKTPGTRQLKMPPEKKRSHEMPRRKNHTPDPAAARNAAHGAPSPAPVPGTGPAPDDPAAAVQAALAASPDGATAAAIAGAAGISRTAAREALTGLETAGAAERTKGGRPGIPDTWRPVAPASPATDTAAPAGSGDPADPAGDPAAADLASDDEPTAQPGTGDGEPAQDDPAGQDAAGGAEPAAAAPTEAGDGQQAGDGDAGDSAEASPDPAVTAEIAGHVEQIQSAASAIAIVLQGGNLQAALAGIEEIYEQAGQARRTLKAAVGGKKAPAAQPGGLREKVAAHLRDHPGEDFTPHEIHKVLGNSSGAIANALDTLVKLSEAELATEKPRRFRLAGGTTAEPAASGTTPAGGQASTASDDDERVAGAA